MTVRGGGWGLVFPGQQPLFSVLSIALLEEMCCPGVPPTGLNWSQFQSPHSLITLSSQPCFFLHFPPGLCSSLEAYTAQLGLCQVDF